MDAETSAIASVIGARVRLERQSRRWTLDRLAEGAGVSRRMVVNIEQGAVNPSVGTLLRISDALGVGLPALVASPQPTPVTVTRRGEGPVLWRSEAGGRAVLVAGTVSGGDARQPNAVELWDWALAPGDRHDSEAHAAGTRELVHVQQGALTIEVGDQVVALEAGDAVAFPGDVAHAYVNGGAEAARFSLAVFEPGVGTSTTAEATHA